MEKLTYDVVGDSWWEDDFLCFHLKGGGVLRLKNAYPVSVDWMPLTAENNDSATIELTK